MDRVNVDRWGALVGTLCAIHCALTGFALGLLSWFGLSFVGSETTEWIFISLAVVLGGLAVALGHRKHRSLVPAFFFCLGIAAIGFSHFGLKHASVPGAISSICGGLFLITFHFLNQRYSRACEITQTPRV